MEFYVFFFLIFNCKWKTKIETGLDNLKLGTRPHYGVQSERDLSLLELIFLVEMTKKNENLDGIQNFKSENMYQKENFLPCCHHKIQDETH